MKRITLMATLLGASMMTLPTTAKATDDSFAFWLQPSVEFDVEDDVSIEIETGQRFASESDGQVDTYFARFWVRHQFRDNVILSGALEQRENDGGFDEVRTTQQIATEHGILRTRFQFEQRWVEDQSRVGFIMRPRLGVNVPLDNESEWSLISDAELFFTLNSEIPGGDDGLTAVRTRVGVSYEASEKISLSLTYLRQQDFLSNAEDRVTHAPFLTAKFKL